MSKKMKFQHEFIGNGEEELVDIFKRQFVRYVNSQKGYSYITLKKEVIKGSKEVIKGKNHSN